MDRSNPEAWAAVLPEREPLAAGLYLVATPVGNLEDMTLRGVRVLREADQIACEDTRQTQKLLNHFGLRTPAVSYHRHNEAERSAELVEGLRAGRRIALVSDAGTPGIADPGSVLVRAAIEAGVAVYPVPGANAALSALVASGLPTEQFAFVGFLPAKPGERRSALERLRDRLQARSAGARETLILYEAPHRILEMLADVEAVFGGDEGVVVARELTKVHEEFLRGPVAEVRATLAARDSVRGEQVVLLAPEPGAAAPGQEGESVAEAVARLLAGGEREKEALKQVARERSLGKSDVYREWQRRKGRPG